jgi:hypothetical protein
VFDVLPESLPVAVLFPVLAEAVPSFVTATDWLAMTMPPRLPPAVRFATWLTPVLDELPVELASPVVMPAVPFDVLLAVPVLLATEPPVAPWRVLAVLPESFPVAELPPVFDVAVPVLLTVADWLTMRIPPSPPGTLALPFAVWLMPVLDELPVDVALPVVTPAVPFDEFVAVPVLLATVPPPPAACPLVAVLPDPFPVAVLPPVVAVAVPPFETVAS